MRREHNALNVNLNVPPLRTPVKPKAVFRTLPTIASGGPPPLPPRNPIAKPKTPGPRSVSESDVPTNKNNNRRAIFGKYWNNNIGYCAAGSTSNAVIIQTTTTNHNRTNHNNRTTPPQPQRVHKRSSSLSILETTALTLEPKDVRMFAPPKEHACRSAICSRFASVESFTISSSLPPLPSPLARLCSDGSHSTSLHGMYPLVTPIPILRQSSYRSLLNNTANDNTNASSSPPQSPHRKQSSYHTNNKNETFNLTESIGPDQFDVKDLLRLPSDTTSSSSTSERETTSRNSIQFDPRVTVTEFEDSMERRWYDEIELEQLKQETIVIAQAYLLAHPQQAEKYNRSTLDPVTGTFRKKALFSLPVLSFVMNDDYDNDNDDDTDNDTEDALPAPHCTGMRGSDLLNAINLMEAHAFAPPPPSSSSSHNHNNHIWGEPIPRVGEALRNQLLNALVRKRRRSAPAGSIEGT
jgi:hypothetical protein